MEPDWRFGRSLRHTLGPPGGSASACLAALPWHAAAFGAAGPDFRACAAGTNASVLWELRLFLPAYALWPRPAIPRYLDMPAVEPDEAARAVAQLRRVVRARVGHEPLVLPISLCTPAACNAALVQEVLLPRHLEIEFFNEAPPWPRPHGGALAAPATRLPPAGCCSTVVSWTSGGPRMQVPPLARFQLGAWALEDLGDAALCASLIHSVDLPDIPFGAPMQPLLLQGGDASIFLEDPSPAQALAEAHWEACNLLGIMWRPAAAIVLHWTLAGAWHEEQFMVCSPCEEASLAKLIRLAVLPPSLSKQPWLRTDILVQPLLPWSLASSAPGARITRPALDFAIIGFAKSGTTTLAQNLNAHPNITMANCGPPCPAPGRALEVARAEECATCEFRFWSLQHLHDFFVSTVAVADLRGRFDGQKVRAGAKRGIKDSVAIRFAGMLPRVGQIPGLRLVVAVRDPVDSFESRYNWYQCGGRYGRDPVDMAARGLHSCSLHRHPGAPLAHESAQLRALLAVVPRDRVHVLHAESLRGAPTATYGALLRFLGVAPFPAGHAFLPDANVGPSASSSRGVKRDLDLCAPEQRGTLNKLKAIFAGEYSEMLAHLEASGSPAPAPFQQRLTRCERQWSEVPPPS